MNATQTLYYKAVWSTLAAMASAHGFSAADPDTLGNTIDEALRTQGHRLARKTADQLDDLRDDAWELGAIGAKVASPAELRAHLEDEYWVPQMHPHTRVRLDAYLA